MKPDDFRISAFSSFGSGGWIWTCRICGHDRDVPNPPAPNTTYAERQYATREEAEAAALASHHRCPGMVDLGIESKLDRIIELLEGMGPPPTGAEGGYSREPGACGYHDWTGPLGRQACTKCGLPMEKSP